MIQMELIHKPPFLLVLAIGQDLEHSVNTTHRIQPLVLLWRIPLVFIYSGNSNGLRIATLDAYDLTFGTNNAAKVTIKSGGNVGIGTTSPRGEVGGHRCGQCQCSVDNKRRC